MTSTLGIVSHISVYSVHQVNILITTPGGGVQKRYKHVVQTGSGVAVGKATGEVKLTTYLQLVPRTRIRGSIHPLPRTSSWHSVYLVKHRDSFHLYFYRLASSLCFVSQIPDSAMKLIE
jgi:hypothetical protein